MDSNQLAVRPVSTKKDYGSTGGRNIAAALLTERSRSSSLANASFRVYYYSLRAGAVPFLWESAPGTPKSATTAAVPLPPAETETVLLGTTAAGEAREEEVMPPMISPPPSYLSSSSHLKAAGRCGGRARSSSWLAKTAGGVLRALRGVLGLRKSHRQSRGRRPTPASYL